MYPECVCVWGGCLSSDISYVYVDERQRERGERGLT